MNILDQIVETKREEVKELRKRHSLSSFEDMKFFKQKKKDFCEILKDKKNISIIAEIKKYSPSAGLIRENFDHLEIAMTYSSCNVNAISVLTDHNYFGGDVNFLEDISELTNTPLLRKDFIIDEFQILEAKGFGASAILLIAEILDEKQISEYTKLAKEIGLDILLELHSVEQLNKIDFSSNNLIGINNRNLSDFTVDLETSRIIKENIPEDVTVISESGIKSENDINYLKQIKINGILVGEHLMRSDDIKSVLLKLIDWCKIES